MRYVIILLTFFYCGNISSATHPTFKQMMSQAEKSNRLPAGLVSAVAYVESKHKHQCFVKEDGKSKHSSYGLMQIQEASARQVGFKGSKKLLMRPDVNVEYGAAYLAYMLKHTNGDVARALTCYNAGIGSESCKQGKYGVYSGKVLNALMEKR